MQRFFINQRAVTDRILTAMSLLFFLAAFFLAAPMISPTFDRLQSRATISWACRVGPLEKCEAVVERFARSRWPDLFHQAGELACSRGSLKSCLTVGRSALRKGDPRKAARYGELACQKGDAVGCVLWGDAGRTLKDSRAQTFGFHNGCFKFGVGEACVNLAELYLSFHQKQQAIQALKRGCDGSDPSSCDRLQDYVPGPRRVPASVGR